MHTYCPLRPPPPPPPPPPPRRPPGQHTPHNQTTHRPPMPTSTLPPSSPLPAPPPSPSPICAFHSVRSLPLGVPSRPPPSPRPCLSWLAWVASPHHHAPGGREVDGALSRPSPKRNGAPNTCPDYCAFPGCSLSVREGSVRVVTPWNTRTPAPSPSLGSITSATTAGGGQGFIDSVERPQIGIHASLDRVARHNDPWNCDSPLSSRCDSV